MEASAGMASTPTTLTLPGRLPPPVSAEFIVLNACPAIKIFLTLNRGVNLENGFGLFVKVTGFPQWMDLRNTNLFEIFPKC